MDWPINPLEVDPESTVKSILELIQMVFGRLGRRNAVLGLSGGLDSSLAAYLTVTALRAEKVRLFYLPERDSKRIHRRHAQLLASELGSELLHIPITSTLRTMGVYKLLPLSWIPGAYLKSRFINFGKKSFLPDPKADLLSNRLAASGGPWVARGNAYISAKHRIRNVILYKEAERRAGMVIGAANRTEWMTGTFTHWGCDHCADLMPIIHLYRSQLVPLAEHLNLPSEIIHKKADPDVLPGLDDKGELLGTFEIADQILWGLENGFSVEFLSKMFGDDPVQHIDLLVNSSRHYRETPYSLL